MIEQIAIALCGVSAVFFSQCDGANWRRWASVMGLIGQPFWLIATYKAGQWGIFGLCFIYTFAWAKGFHLYWIKERK